MNALSRVLFAIGPAGLGILSIIYGDFAMVWQPVPAWVPLRAVIAYLSGALLLGCGVAMLMKRTATLAALVLTIFFFSWLLVLQVPRVVANPLDEGMWLGFGETLMLVTGGWIQFATRAAGDGRKWGELASGDSRLRMGRYLFAVSLPLVGLSHFVYASGTASMVPAWLPAHLALAHLTGAGHIAAGVGILFGILPGLAATLEALMISAFILLLHIPGVIAAPGSRLQWTMLFVASTLAGAAWAVAGSMRSIHHLGQRTHAD
ncbi:MAG TPA: hypothetical protein VN775_09710 [Opitutaceae bacterium]|nr:hypothetical protein [Opitutaceae bacterium]